MKRWTTVHNTSLLRSLFTLSFSPSPAHSKCLTGSLRKASPLLFPWQLACIGIDDISWSPTYFALKTLSRWTSAMPSQKDDGTVERRRKGEKGFPLDKHAKPFYSVYLYTQAGWRKDIFFWKAWWPAPKIMSKENGFRERGWSIFLT